MNWVSQSLCFWCCFLGIGEGLIRRIDVFFWVSFCLDCRFHSPTVLAAIIIDFFFLPEHVMMILIINWMIIFWELS